MNKIKIVLSAILITILAESLSAALIEDQRSYELVEKYGVTLDSTLLMEVALIETSGGQPSGSAHAFCLALTSEQIGFAIDTLEALGIDGLLNEGQAHSLVSKLQIAQSRLSTENIVAVFKQQKDFIKKINFHTKKGNLTHDNGMLLINSTLSVMCRT